MELKEIKAAIKSWVDIRESPTEVIKYLNEGCCFKVERSFYEQWKKKNPPFIHIYFGIVETKMKVFMIDSVSDQEIAPDMSYLFEKDYLDGLDFSQEGFIAKSKSGDIGVKEALERSLRWTLFRNSWVQSQVKSVDGIFKAFRFPFTDFELEFSADAQNETVVTFGLQESNVPDLIMWGLDNADTDSATIVNSDVEDFSCPVPPYGSEDPESDFGLLIDG